MKTAEALALLIAYQRWRKGCDETVMPHPVETSKALDIAIRLLYEKVSIPTTKQ